MDERLSRELAWALWSLGGALAVVGAVNVTAGIGPPLYALLTEAALGAILVDGWRYYRENALDKPAVGLAELVKPARAVLVPVRQGRPGRRLDPRD